MSTWVSCGCRRTLEEDIKLRNALGTRNPTDLLTKHLDRKTMDGDLGTLGFERRDGRASRTTQLHATQRSIVHDNAGRNAGQNPNVLHEEGTW